MEVGAIAERRPGWGGVDPARAPARLRDPNELRMDHMQRFK